MVIGVVFVNRRKYCQKSLCEHYLYVNFSNFVLTHLVVGFMIYDLTIVEVTESNAG